MRFHGALVGLLIMLSIHAVRASTPTAAAACQPSISALTRVLTQDDGEPIALAVDLRATANVSGGDRLTRVLVTERTNATVEVDGKAPPSSIISLNPPRASWSFVIRRIARGQPFQVAFTVGDLCGDVPKFAGAGLGAAAAAAQPTPPGGEKAVQPTATPVPTATPTTATPAPTATPTPVTAVPSPTATATASPTTTPPPATSDRVSVGTLALTATINSIGLELPFTGDTNANATAAVAFKRASDSTWRSGLPLWRTDDGTQRAFYGSLLQLEPGTRYEVRVTIADPDGGMPSAPVTGTVTTRADAVPPASALAPTHYVRATGNDANAGTSPATAWATLEKAIKAAPDGAVVQVGPGYYARPTSARTLPVSLVAEYPSVDDGRASINAGKHSVIDAGPVASPAGSGGPNAGVWQPVSLSGPGRGGAPAGATYRVWKWTTSGLSSSAHLGYASSRADLPQRIAVWAADSADLATPAGWAEKLYTNQTYNYGAYVSGADVYLRLPPNAPSADPNDLYITVGGGVGLALNGPNIRVSGFEIRQADAGIQLQYRATGGVVDHNLISGARLGVYFRGTSGPPSVYGGDHLVERNRIVDANLWTADHVGQPAIPWNFIKGAIKNADGSTYATAKLGRTSETVGIGGRGGALRAVVRRNTIEGTFNGIGPGYNPGFDRYAGMDMDVHDNLLRRIADDALEPEGQVINFRAWGNRIEQASSFLSTGPVTYGPLYIVRNEGWQIGNAGAGRDNTGVPALSGRGFKYSGKSTPPARVYVLHNTLWTDQASPNAIDGGAQSASSGTSPEAFYLRNNVIRATHAAFEAPSVAGRWDEDYNHFSTTNAAEGLKFGQQRFTTDVGAYRAASGQGAHTNASGSFVTPVSLAGPAAGDLSLPAGSPLIDAGVPIPNISDRPGLDYAGAAPDLGARER